MNLKMDTFTYLLALLSITRCVQSIPFTSDVGISWLLPDGVNLTSFRTTLEIPLQKSTAADGCSIKAFSSYISTSSSEITDTFTAKDSQDGTYIITMGGIEDRSDTLYAEDNVTSMWSSSFFGSVENVTWSNRLFVDPGDFSIGSGTNATSYEIDRVLPVDVYTKFGLRLSLSGMSWSSGDIVWKDTEIWVTDVRNRSWCDSYNITQSVIPVYDGSEAPLPNVTVTHGYSADRIHQHMNVCLLDEIRMIQPVVDVAMPSKDRD